MAEKLLNSGDAGGEKESLRQAKIVTRILQASDNLSKRCGEGTTWHLKSPKFKIPPPILLSGYDVSEKLYTMVQLTQDLHVRLRNLPEDYVDEDYKQPSCYAWEIYPPECHQDKNLPGFGLCFFCPKLTKAVTPVDLDEYRESGSLDIDMLTWFEGGEGSHDRTKPESVLLDMIKQHPTASLETALWILESLHTAEGIHAEEESFDL